MTKKGNKKSSGGGIVGGLLLIVVGIGLLWYNEGRTVKTQGAIKEAKSNYTDVKSETIDEKYDGKLIATKGQIDTSEATTLTDSIFGITAQTAKMVRKVEMYQWEENCESDEDDNKKNCTYKKEWSDNLIDSTKFEESGHNNPEYMPYQSETQIAKNVKIGAFILPEELIRQLSTNKHKTNAELETEYQNKIEGYNIKDTYITNTKEATEEIGDIRISFEYLDNETVSILAVQTGNTFEAFTAKNGKDIYKIVKGSKTGAQILEDMTKSNNFIKWLLRALGTLLVILGFSSMFSIITNLTDKIPILGNIVSGATGLISFLLGISISLIVIAIAWFRFRPILSIILIAIVVLIIVCLKTKIFNKEKK